MNDTPVSTPYCAVTGPENAATLASPVYEKYTYLLYVLIRVQPRLELGSQTKQQYSSMGRNRDLYRVQQNFSTAKVCNRYTPVSWPCVQQTELTKLGQQ